MRELWFNISLRSGAQVYSLLTSLLSLALTARWLGPEGRGIVAAVITWQALFSTLGHLSLGQVALHQATKQRGQVWLPAILGSLLLMTAVITLLAWGVATGLYLSTGGALYNGLEPKLLILGFLALPLAIWERYGSSLLMALDKVSIYNRAQMIGGTAGLVLILLAWWGRLGIAGVLFAGLLSQTLTSLIGTGYLLRQAGRSTRPQWSTIKTLLTGGFALHLSAVGSFLVMSSDVLIINYYRGPVETGYYQLAVKLVSIMLIIPGSANLLLYGKVAQIGPDKAWEYQRKIVAALLVVMAVLSVIAASLAPWGITFFAGKAFEEAVPAFQLLLMVFLGMSFAALMAPQWIGRGLFWQVSLISLFVGGGNLVGGLLLVPRYGMYGSIYGTLVTYFFATFIHAGLAVWCELRFRRNRLSQATQVSQ